MSAGQSKESRRESARARAAQDRARRLHAQRRRRYLWSGAVILAAAVIIALTATIVVHSLDAAAAGPLTGPPGPEGIVLEQGERLAADTTSPSGATRDGVQCSASEQVAYHIHAHLSVYVDGALRPIPGGIGVVAPVPQSTAQGTFYQASTCYYWLHVHAADGVIHVEAPTEAQYTLGQFFAVWQQPLTRTTVASATGRETVYVDGRRYTGDPAAIVLRSHENIQIDIGAAVPFRDIDWSHSEL